MFIYDSIAISLMLFLHATLNSKIVNALFSTTITSNAQLLL